MTFSAAGTVATPIYPEGKPQRRSGSVVMQSHRLAALQPSRISASRALIAKAIKERWDIRPIRFDINEHAEGVAVYRIKTPRQVFSFVAFSATPVTQGRTGRIIGRVWDMMGTLNEGEATESDLESARLELPKLYAGRATPNALVWCRSNRSMRIFDLALKALSEGRQPEIAEIAKVCYLMRNTGLDGNGTFGTRAFSSLGNDHALGRPLAAQMLTAYMMREFAADLVSHLARIKSSTAVPLAPETRRFLGVGNGSALGLILFINKHPRLIHHWIAAREEAIAEAKALDIAPGDARLTHLATLIERASHFRRQDRMVYEAFAPSAQIAEELNFIAVEIRALAADGATGQRDYPLAALADAIEPKVHPETFETFLSLLIELVPEFADSRLDELASSDEFVLDAAMSIGGLRRLIETEYGWALQIDMNAEGSRRYTWYKSETAEEPRRGPREEVPGAINLGLDLPGEIQALYQALCQAPTEQHISHLLLTRPDLRRITARVQSLAGMEYHAPHVNIMGEDFVPIHLVRLMNVAIHGIDKTRDFLSRNLRGVLFHGAPLPEDIREGCSENWYYPPEPSL